MKNVKTSCGDGFVAEGYRPGAALQIRRWKGPGMAFGQTALFLFQGIHLASNVVLGYSAGMGPGALLKREMFDIASHAVLF